MMLRRENEFAVTAARALPLAARPRRRERANGDEALEELIRTNDMVLISFVEALLKDAGIAHLVVDQNMSVIEGSLGVLPRRVLVGRDEVERARTVLEAAGVGDELRPPDARP
jgi:hypothetical protein